MSASTELPYVRWAGVDISLPHTAMRPRRLYDHELVYTLSGGGWVVFEGQEYSVGVDQCFFHQPRQSHAARNDSEESWVTIGVHFDWKTEADVEFFPTFQADDGRRPTDESLFRAPQNIAGWDTHGQRILNLRGRPLVRHFLEETVTAFSRGDEYSRSQSGALFLAAIYQLQREIGLLAQSSALRSIGPDAQRRLSEARLLLEKVAPQTPTVAQVARQVGWSADYLAFMARTAWGITPRHLQNSSRLHRARQLLREGKAVAEVAHQCGFADTSHLARAFRKESGMTPREYSSLAGRAK